MLNCDLKLLLIEDCKLSVEFFKDILNKINGNEFNDSKFELIVKTNLKETHDYLTSNTPDIVISDLTLPDSTSTSTLEYLKNYTMDIPIIILTGSDQSNIAIKAIQEGFQDYLVKGEFEPNNIYRSLMYSVERHKLISKMRTLSLIDELTCLYNRRGFNALTKNYYKLLNREKKGAGILYIDLNNLKVINDTYGHKAGDSAIIQTANILQKCSRNSDVVGRMGGDEFSIFFYNCEEKDFPVLMNRLQSVLDNYNEKKLNPFDLSISTGLVYCDCSQDTLEETIAKADKLMYENKIKSKKQRS